MRRTGDGGALVSGGLTAAVPACSNSDWSKRFQKGSFALLPYGGGEGAAAGAGALVGGSACATVALKGRPRQPAAKPNAIRWSLNFVHLIMMLIFNVVSFVVVFLTPIPAHQTGLARFSAIPTKNQKSENSQISLNRFWFWSLSSAPLTAVTQLPAALSIRTMLSQQRRALAKSAFLERLAIQMPLFMRRRSRMNVWL
jgi:hypothetical protein